ncbi:M4 family metallopeptidase [Staphylococcus kloosii]|jgi:aureolysin|uniref:M4 family metallopeptidase n=1 Tax=Staphylococcus kloosii TaxID=29384 RepID=UPI00189F608B|nr:M4 family metallopeptidase [Staphylococcus kloosii]MBF7029113.1 peptidase M4 family protein [Staphylococcus kloosii]
MKKFWTCTIATCTLLAFSTNFANAAEQSQTNSVTAESLTSIKKQPVNSDTSAEHLLQNNATKILEKSTPNAQQPKLPEAFNQYTVINRKEDNTGGTHYELQPKIHNVVASDSVIKVHVDKNDKTTLVNGTLNKPYLNVNNKISLTKQQAEKKAFEAIGLARNQVKNIDGYKVINNNKLDINSDKQRYVYNVEINYSSPYVAHWKIQVDATNGAILKKDDIIEEASVKGKGTGVNGDIKKPLNLTSAKVKGKTQYTLNDTSQKAKMNTKTANNTTTWAVPITNTTSNFNKSSQKAGVDPHYYANEIYHYYLKKFNRNSYDNKGGRIDSFVHYGKNFNNAAWTGQYMIYGDGDGKQFKALSASKDIIAHELTHAVTARTAKLVYKNQTGALNESISDVFAYFVDPNDWLIGEDAYTPKIKGDGIRSISNPEKYKQPAHMKNYYNGPNDSGGVHINSGIPNKAAYLTIKAIGKDKAERVYYLTLTRYLTPNAKFHDAKVALKKAAAQLYGAKSKEVKAIDKAWNDVGVLK